MSQEVHEILFKTNYAEVKKTEADMKVFTSQQIANDKIRVDSAKTTNKILVEEEKLTNKISLIDYQETLRKKREADKQYKKDAEKFTGQSVELGSKSHIQGLKRELAGLAPGTEKYVALNNQLKNLEANYKAARGSNSIFNRGLLETGENLTTIIAGFYLASSAVIGFGKASVTAYAEQEKSLTQLTAVTGDNVALRDRLIGKSTDIQNTFGIPDETIQSLQAFLVLQGRSEEQINKTIEAARLLSIVQGTDIRDALMKVDATFEGQIGKLGKLGTEFKSLTQEQLENGGAVDIIINKYGKFGDIQDTTYTKTQKLSAAWSETKETIGGLLVDGIGPLITGLSNLGLKGQDTVKIIASAVIGFNTWVGAAKKLVDIFKSVEVGTANLIVGISNLGSQLPVVGGFFGSLTNMAEGYKQRLLEILGLQQNIGGALTQDAKGGIKFIGTAKDIVANGGNFTTNKGNSGNSGTTKEAELNFLEQYRKKIADLEKEIASLNLLQADANTTEREKLVISDELIKKQKELNELKRVNMGLEAFSKTGTLPGTPDLRIGRNATGGDSGTAENASKLMIERLEREKQFTEGMLSNFSGMFNSTLSMLQNMGFINDGFAKAVALINSIVNAGSGIISGILGIAGLLLAPATGGASIPIAAGVGGAVGGLNANPRTGGSLNNTQVVIYNPITLREGLRVETRIDNMRGGIDI